MLKYQNKGYTILVPIPEECGHVGYYAECTYRYDKEKEKYLLSMGLTKEIINDRFKIDNQKIDTQYISGTKETIRNNIRRIVEQASLTGFFDPYIKRYEYTCKCFDKGNELFEKERLSDAS